MTPPGIKPCHGLALTVCTQRILGLVAVMIRFLTAQNRLRLQLKAAQPLKGVLYRLLLEPQFLLIGDMPEGTAATLPEHRAIHLLPDGGRRYHLLQQSISIVLLYLDRLETNPVAHRRHGHKYRKSIHPADTVSLQG